MIFQGSRYEGAVVATVKSDRGFSTSVFREIKPPLLVGEFVIGENETLMDLAHRAYGDPELWWHIADANPELLYPDQIPAGTVIKVPNVSTLR